MLCRVDTCIVLCGFGYILAAISGQTLCDSDYRFASQTANMCVPQRAQLTELYIQCTVYAVPCSGEVSKCTGLTSPKIMYIMLVIKVWLLKVAISIAFILIKY